MWFAFFHPSCHHAGAARATEVILPPKARPLRNLADCYLLWAIEFLALSLLGMHVARVLLHAKIALQYRSLVKRTSQGKAKHSTSLRVSTSYFPVQHTTWTPRYCGLVDWVGLCWSRHT